MFQTLDEQGKPEGTPTYGIIASDNYESDFNNNFDSFEELNKEIDKTGCILNLVSVFSEYGDQVGKENYYGPVKEDHFEELQDK